MVNTKKKLYDAAVILKAIGHPIRVEIIIELSKRAQMNVTELSESLGLEQPITSLHLSILRNKSIIISKKEGTQSFYKIQNNYIKQIVSIIYYSSINY